jgi:N-terminal half of MaoC dehydratase
VLGRWVSDLGVGDVLDSVDHVLTPFLIREYAHAVEDSAPRHHDPTGMVAPPTIVHAYKILLLDHACPEGPGPAARVHLVYDAKYHRPLPVARELSIAGEVIDRYARKGREHLVIEFEVRDKLTGEMYTSYRDTSLLSYRPGD